MGDLIRQLTDAMAGAPLLVLGLVALVSLASGLVPGPPVEGTLLAVAAVAPDRLLLPLVVLTTASHMVTRTVLFVAGGRLNHLLPIRQRSGVERACSSIARHPQLQVATLFGSAVAGLPPFYVTTLAYGALHTSLRAFVLVGTAGRAIRFGAVVLASRLVTP